MANNGILAAYDALRTVAFGSVTTSYTLIGSKFEHPVRILIITNATDKGLFFSYDGITDQTWIAPNSIPRQINYCANSADAVGLLEQSAQEGVYIKYAVSAPTAGAVYVEVIYAKSNENR